MFVYLFVKDEYQTFLVVVIFTGLTGFDRYLSCEKVSLMIVVKKMSLSFYDDILSIPWFLNFFGVIGPVRICFSKYIRNDF